MTASLRRIWIQLTTDRKRFGVLCATFGVGLLLWARLIIVSNVSRTAMADNGSAALSAKPGAAATSVSAKAGANAADKPSTKDPGKAGGKSRQTVEVQLWSRCERDPFVISPTHFPRASALSEVKPEAGKLPTQPAEDASQVEARRVARLREVSRSLRLEASMGNSMAVIDGEQYRVGDLLPAVGNEHVVFTLIEIKQRSVMLEFQGRRVELEMSKPGVPDPQA